MELQVKMNLLFGKSKWVLYIIGLFIGIAMGIINPLASTHLEQNNVSSICIGIVESSFFLFMSIGSAYINKRMSNKNIKTIILVGSITSAIACGIFPFVSSLFLFILLMVVMGFGISFNIVGVQTILQNLTGDDTRGVVSGLYSFYFAIGFVLSSVIGPKLYIYSSWLPFMIPIITLLLCPFILNSNFKGKLLFPGKLKENVLKKVTIGLQGAFLYGFTETTLVTLYPIFLLHKNYSLSNLGYAVAIFVVGSIIGTIPMTYISDKFGHEKILIVIITISIFTVLGIIGFNSFWMKLVCSFLSGFVIGPIYPLALAVTVQKLGREEISSATSLFTSSYGIGSTIGPLVSSTAMSLLGDNYIFSVCLLIFIVFLFTTYLKRGTYQSKLAV